MLYCTGNLTFIGMAEAFEVDINQFCSKYPFCAILRDFSFALSPRYEMMNSTIWLPCQIQHHVEWWTAHCDPFVSHQHHVAWWTAHCDPLVKYQHMLNDELHTMNTLHQHHGEWLWPSWKALMSCWMMSCTVLLFWKAPTWTSCGMMSCTLWPPCKVTSCAMVNSTLCYPSKTQTLCGMMKSTLWSPCKATTACGMMNITLWLA